MTTHDFWEPFDADDFLATGPASTVQSLLGSGAQLWSDEADYEALLEQVANARAAGRRAAGSTPRLAPELIAHQVAAMEHDEARRHLPAVEPTPLLPVEMRVLLTEQEIQEASRPLGLGLSSLLPARPDLCSYDVSIRLPVRPFEPVLCGCGRVQERSGAATCNYCDAQERGR